MENISNLKSKVKQYQRVLENTIAYRAAWKSQLKDEIINRLTELTEATGLEATIEVKEQMENLEAIVLSLGETKSGLSQKINAEVQRHLIKHNGSLIYQQLFNGKVIVLINYPQIEGYGQPRPPKNIAIYRPEEIKPPFLLRHLEDFMKEVTNWEDYDDDEPAQRIGFNMNFMAPQGDEAAK